MKLLVEDLCTAAGAQIVAISSIDRSPGSGQPRDQSTLKSSPSTSASRAAGTGKLLAQIEHLAANVRVQPCRRPAT